MTPSRRARADPACRADLPDPAEEYDRALRAFDDPVQVSYADPDGTVRPHAVDAAAIDSAISQLLYEPTGRSLVLRAVAAAERGDEVPLARLSDLLGSGEGPGASEFAYYAITCADYRVSPTADPHDFQAVEDYARRNGISTLRTAGVFTSQYPCLSWPYQPATGRPSGSDHLDAVPGLRPRRGRRPDHAGRGGPGDRRSAHRWLPGHVERRAARHLRSRRFVRGRAGPRLPARRPSTGDPVDLVRRGCHRWLRRADAGQPIRLPIGPRCDAGRPDRDLRRSGCHALGRSGRDPGRLPGWRLVLARGPGAKETVTFTAARSCPTCR